jgi:thiamine pyrophosphokinase
MTYNIETGTTPSILPCNVKAAVFLNGECDLPGDYFRKRPEYQDFDFFCADGGADIALKFSIIPMAIVGDMDSISNSAQKKLQSLSRFIKVPSEKDKSDGELLLEMLGREGYQEVHIFAATGGRIDQTLFNIQLLQKYTQAKIITRIEEMYCIGPTAMIENKSGHRASLIPLSENVAGLTTEGFKYNLALTDINSASTLTLSNVIISDIARVTYHSGRLLMVLSVGSEANSLGNHSLKLIKGRKNRINNE